MKSLKRAFDNLRKAEPGYSSYIAFALTINQGKYDKKTINKWFDKLVDKDDYLGLDKNSLLNQLYTSSESKKPAEEKKIKAKKKSDSP